MELVFHQVFHISQRLDPQRFFSPHNILSPGPTHNRQDPRVRRRQRGSPGVVADPPRVSGRLRDSPRLPVAAVSRDARDATAARAQHVRATLCR